MNRQQRREERRQELQARLDAQRSENKARKQQRADTRTEVKAVSGKEAKLLVRARQHFHDGETVSASLLGAFETKLAGNDTVRHGILIATDRRIVFYAKRAFGYDFKQFPYKAITSIEAGHRMMGDYLSLYVSNNEITVKWLHGDVHGFVALVQAQIDAR